MKTKEFFEDLVNLAKKHGVIIMSGNIDNLVKTTKGLEGHHIFFTNGEKVLELKGGEKMMLDSSLTITMKKNRYGKK